MKSKKLTNAGKEQIKLPSIRQWANR